MNNKNCFILDSHFIKLPLGKKGKKRLKPLSPDISSHTFSLTLGMSFKYLFIFILHY